MCTSALLEMLDTKKKSAPEGMKKMVVKRREEKFSTRPSADRAKRRKAPQSALCTGFGRDALAIAPTRSVARPSGATSRLCCRVAHVSGVFDWHKSRRNSMQKWRKPKMTSCPKDILCRK
jgi:hypothetical protein